ncbi:RNA 2'-phosphotransferase [Rhizobium sp. RU36D]|uniref:RNA 2'-phosphotransferase n=1 Tax=Rhizobium sp. RU36D TaxID=1907415 RepID=UPI0009D7CF0A|nr:RNA 2'-phosphotransferase [Rhizobium sp. RU36D]SMC81605.1 putative RNA 2'-phosphotransferase [Rhizobium sp. RU36D]
MTTTSDTDLSKFMSYILRHAPEELGLALDDAGWTDYDVFSQRVCERIGVTDDDIIRVISTNSKKRFTLDGSRIRAAQGHSVGVDLAAQVAAATDVLYHGTTAEAWASIQTAGLKPMDRTHVHLSADLETARQVAGRRKGPHVLLMVPARQMEAKGYSFLRADNGVWLTANVPADFLSIVSEIA